MHRLSTIGAAALLLIGLWPAPSLAQAVAAASQIDALRREIQSLQERLNRLEQQQRVPTPAVTTPAAPATTAAPPTTVAPPSAATPSTPAAPPTAQLAPRPGEREIQLEREHPLEVIGLPKPEVGTLRLAGFFVGSANYRSHLQLAQARGGPVRRALAATVLALEMTTAVATAVAHVTPPVVLMSDRQAVATLLAGARRFFVREVRVTAELRRIVQ